MVPFTSWHRVITSHIGVPNLADVFPECVARVPVSLWVSGGWGCVSSTLRLRSQPSATVRNRPQPSATVRNRPQPSATVRNRPRDPHMAVPMVSFAEVIIFGGFKLLVASFRVAGVALHDIQTCFVTCRKWFCVAGAMLSRRSVEDALHFSWQWQHFERVHRHFAWQAQRFRRVGLRVFANRIGRAASSGDKVQIPW